MAAHILTFFKEVIELNKKGKFDDKQHELFQQALDFAPLGNQPEYADWVELHCKFPSEFINAVTRLLPKYEKIWNDLGQPKIYEEWKKNENRKFILTVDWCSQDKRGPFISREGNCFWRQDRPHTADEMYAILGPFDLILSPKSELFTEKQIALYKVFVPLKEYSDAYGIALTREQYETKIATHIETTKDERS